MEGDTDKTITEVNVSLPSVVSMKKGHLLANKGDT